MSTKKDYHDYVIKDGKFIGEFEDMYKDCDDPWMQSEQPNLYSRMSGIIHLKNFGIKEVLECGCGLGYYSSMIHQQTGIVPIGIDISETAIDKAKQLFPELNFSVADIPTDLDKFKHADCVMLSEIVWYILPQFDELLGKLKSDFSGKYLMVNQVFYKGSQKYGTEYFTSIEEFIEYVKFPVAAYCKATTENDSTIESSILFRIP